MENHSSGQVSFNSCSSGSDSNNGEWQFLRFDAEYRPVLVNTITHQIKALDRYTILWDEQHNPTYIPL